MGKTRPVPLSPWPTVETGRLAARADATVHLGTLDILPADPFEARLAEVDGARFGAAVVRGGRVVASPLRAPPPPATPRAEPSPSTPFAAAVAARDDRELVSSFRTGPLARLFGWLARLRRG